MSSLKLKHSSGNGTIINAPAANPSADITLKVPSTTGSAGQVLAVASANHSSTNAELEWAADAGKFASYAVICDQKANNTNGGQPPNTTAYNKRDLNTEIADADGIVSISSNEFTLQAGTYLVKARAPGFRMDRHQAKLYNVTDSSDIQYGSSEHSADSVAVTTYSHITARFTLSGAKALAIYHRCENTDGEGYGLANNFSNVQIYTVVEIFKEA